MLISFSVSNFRSISEKQTLSFEAKPLKEDDKKGNIFTAEYRSRAEKIKKINLLKSIVLYGANSSGKSNLLEALQFFISNIKFSFSRGSLFTNEEDIHSSLRRRIDMPTAFKLLNNFKQKPTIFEIIFLSNEGIKYRYYLEIDLNKQAINKEIAFYSPNGQEILLFERNLKKINLKPLTINKEAEYAIQDSLKENENVLLVSILKKFGIEKSLPIYNFSNFFAFVKAERSIISKINLSEDIKYKKFTIKLLKDSIDSSICDIEIKKEKEKYRFLRFPKIYIIRKNHDGNRIEFDLKEESAGTRKIFDFSYFLYHLKNKKDKTIIVFDEFDNYLHPALMEFLLEFIYKNIKTNFQILIATHNTSLIGRNLNLFRRDQIWFTQKGFDNNTELYPLTDYNTRANEDFEKNYLKGRYGAIMGLEDKDYDL